MGNRSAYRSTGNRYSVIYDWTTGMASDIRNWL